MNYKGVIIEESLADAAVLKKVKVLSKRTSPVTEKSETPWISQWTLYDIEVIEAKADHVAQLLSDSIEFEHKSSWYADYKNSETHYIIFKNRIFKIDRSSKQQYDEAYAYGLSVGIPAYQLITFESQKLKD